MQDVYKRQVYAYNIFYRPQQLFDTTKEQISTPTPTPANTPLPDATPTPDPYEEMLSVADLSMMKDIVNVLIVGVDYAPERETWSGKHAYHADVMLVLAINFEENTVDMISLPRDTYAKIPGVEGIYKLNASIDCGGGFPEGFPKAVSYTHLDVYKRQVQARASFCLIFQPPGIGPVHVP